MATDSSLGTENQRPRSGSGTLPLRLTIDSIHALGVSDPTDLEYAVGKQKNEDKLGLSTHVPSSPSFQSATETHENTRLLITRIRATDLEVGLGRTPLGFYVSVHHNGLEWRTEIKRLLMDEDLMEWGGLIPIPSVSTAIVCLEVYASFEVQPMLGNGERLHKLTTTVKQLQDRNAQGLPFIFLEDEDLGSPCSSLLVTVSKQQCENDPLGFGVLEPGHPTSEFQSELQDVTDQGHKAFSRYREQRERHDLECAIGLFERALSICPLGHPCRAAAQSNAAEAKLFRCLLGDADSSLDVPLALYRDALAARPVGHPDRPFTLVQLAAVHFARFEKWRDEAEASQADTLLHEVMDLGPPNGYESQAAATMLQLHKRHVVGAVQPSGQLSVEQDLEDTDLWDLSVQLLQRFKQSANLADLQQAISVLERLLVSISVWDERYLPGLQNLSLAFSYRFSHLGDLSDLEKAISMQRDVVDLAPDDHPDKPTYLSNLGDSFKTRFERLGEQSDLEQAILMIENAVDVTPDDHPDKSAYLTNLGGSFRARFERLGDMDDLERTISRQRVATDLAPDGHPDKSTCLNNLGNSFLVRFKRLGELNDLEEAISRHRDAVALTPDNHSTKPLRLSNLGTSFINRFERLGEPSDLARAISCKRRAVYLTPDEHVNKPVYLDDLGVCLLHCFEHLGELSDLEQAISRQRDATNLTPDNHPGKSARLNNLGNSLLIRFEHLKEPSDLEQAISSFRDSVDITPDDQHNKPAHLNGLSNSLLTRFEHFGDLNDLEQAVSCQRVAVDSTPDDHPERCTYLNNLGNCLSTRFDRLGELSDLEEATSKYKSAVDSTPEDHSNRPACLNNLGNSYLARFERLGELTDLQQAILKFEAAYDSTLRLDGQPNKPAYLTNLAGSLFLRYELLGELNDLEQAISQSTDAVDLSPIGHPHKRTCLYNLGRFLLMRFEHLDEQDDLEHAISTLRDAVDLTANDHVFKPSNLNILGKSYLARFKLSGDPRDFERAISKQRDAVGLTPDGHSDKPSLLSDLGDSFRARFERLGKLGDLEQAMSLYSHAACASVGPATHRFSASQQWVSCARTLRHHSLLQACSVAVDLLPQLAWIGLSLAHRYRELVQGVDVVREAAATALDSGHPETAVEWLEQGRSVVWGELFRLRSSYDELSSAHPNHARRLRELSAALEDAGAVREKALSSSEETRRAERRRTVSLEQVADRHRALAIRRDELLQEIRRLPGFERFLLRKEFSQLRASAHSGPVVVLNAAESRCDALIVLAKVNHAIHVPLPNYAFERSKELQNTLRKLLGVARTRAPRDDRYGQPAQRDITNAWRSILSPLWKCVVKPVLDALGFSHPTPGDVSRIFWCPTGPFSLLPIHAAGYYDTRFSQPGHKVFDFVVSSYVPTLGILLPSSNLTAASSDGLRFLAVRQPQSDGLARLPGVDVELEHIRTVINNSPWARTTFVESSEGTVEEVVALMTDANWVHFACHGVQDIRNPTRTGLCLANGRRLQLSDVVALSRPRGGLAFLSACQTAMGDEALPDEAIHIAAGMLFAGYGGVVGTMWSISDALAPRVAKDVYEQLFREHTVPDHREAARALQDAVGRLRSESNASFLEWLPFIHVGL